MKNLRRPVFLLLVVVLFSAAALADSLGPVTTTAGASVSTGFSYTQLSGHDTYRIGPSGVDPSTSSNAFGLNLGSATGTFDSGSLTLAGLISGSYSLTNNNHNWNFTYGWTGLRALAGSSSMALSDNGTFDLAPLLSEINNGYGISILGNFYLTISDAGGGAIQTGQTYLYSYETCITGFPPQTYQCNKTYATPYYTSGSSSKTTVLTASAELTPKQQAPVPEPATILVLGGGLLGLLRRRR